MTNLNEFVAKKEIFKVRGLKKNMENGWQFKKWNEKKWKMGDNLKNEMKSSLWSFYFSIDNFLVPTVFWDSILTQNFIFFIFHFLFWEIKEKVGGFRLKRDKILVDIDSNHDMSRYWCQQVPFNSESFTRVFFGLFIVWYGRYKLEIFFEFGLIIGVRTNLWLF